MADTPIIITDQTTHIEFSDGEITNVYVTQEETVINFEGEQGPPGPPGKDGVGANPADFAHFHNQMTPSSEWNVSHALGFYPNFHIVDSAGDLVTPMGVIHDSVNVTRIQFLGPMSGQAYLS